MTPNQRMVEELKNNDKGFYALTKEQQKFLQTRKQGEVCRRIRHGKFVTVNKDEVGINDVDIHFLASDFELPYKGLFVPTEGVDLLDPRRTRLICKQDCAVHASFGNGYCPVKCQLAICKECICAKENADVLRQWQKDHGGMKRKREPASLICPKCGTKFVETEK